MNPAAPLVLWRNARICPAGDSGQVIDRGAIAAQGDRIVWIGDDQHIPIHLSAAAFRTEDLLGRWITPGFVDCHTHLVFASSRADEFRMRLAGATYQEIARAGGGINSTVRATRSAGEEALYQQSARRLKALLAEGVTALEIKSGYGLNLETERKMLRVARRLGQEFPVSIYTTFLGAHAVPDESTGRADDYIRSVCDEMLPTLHREGLVDAVDVFCENIAFTAAQSERVFQKAVDLGLPVKIHAGQLSDLGAVRLAARYRALSADHLEHLDEPAVRDMKTAGMVAVLLPGASYFLREARLPPVDLLRRHQVPIAVATDCNPGTSPATSILLTMNLACTLFRLTPDEALAAVTRHAAQALGKATDHGLLAEGRYADFCVWDIDSLAELGYWMGFNPCHAVIRHGVVSQGEL